MAVISAPAGSGKTSLLRAWAGRPGQPHRLALVQVRRGQQDAQQFWLAMLRVVRAASGTISGAEPPAATPDFNGQAMVDRVVSELVDAPGGITVVVDDLHELNSPEALAQVTRLLASLPPNVHAILTTRHDLRLRLHRLRLVLPMRTGDASAWFATLVSDSAPTKEAAANRRRKPRRVSTWRRSAPGGLRAYG